MEILALLLIAGLVLALKLILTNVIRPQGSYKYRSSGGSPVRSKGSVVAERVFSLTGFVIVMALAIAMFLWTLGGFRLDLSLVIVLGIGIVAIAFLTTAIVRTMHDGKSTPWTFGKSFALMLSSWTHQVANFGGRLTTSPVLLADTRERDISAGRFSVITRSVSAAFSRFEFNKIGGGFSHSRQLA